MKLDLSFFLEPPDKNREAELHISALAPLSMVSNQPGTYFRSELRPTKPMLMGLLENALGWHFEEGVRADIFKALQKAAKKKHGKKAEYADSDWLNSRPETSGSGYFSLLHFHLSISEVEVDETPMTYDDLWSMQLRTKGESFIGGSRNYDARLEKMITHSRTKSDEGQKKEPPIVFGDRKGFETYSIEELIDMESGKVKTTCLKAFFPEYYSSPKTRGYVVPNLIYKYKLECTGRLAEQLTESLSNPMAPLYLGTNDGWVDIKWVNHE